MLISLAPIPAHPNFHVTKDRHRHGEHQVADQAHRHQQEGAGAQQGGQERAQDRHPRHHAAIAAGDKKKADEALRLASKKLDKATSKGVIHANQAANRKSAISKQVAALS